MTDSSLNLIRVLLLIGALFLVVLGVVVGGVGLLVGVLGPADRLMPMVIISLSFLTLSGGLGAAMAWQLWQALQGRGSRPFQPKGIGALVLILIAALVVGQLILAFDLLPGWTFPPLYLVAALVPPWIILSLIGRRLAPPTRWRDVVFQLSSGALLSTSLAFVVELAALLTVSFLMFSAVTIRPGGAKLLQALAQALQQSAWLEDPDRLISLVRMPVVVATASFLVVGVVPVVEEALKTIGTGLWIHRRPGMSEAFMWGVCNGAGFAMAEGLFNSVNALPLWTPVAVLRIGAALMHCFTGGITALAWHSGVVRRRWGRAAGLYLASVGLHGLWNAVAVAMTLFSLSMGGAGDVVP